MSNGTAFGLTTQTRAVNLDGVIGTNDFLGGKGVNRAAAKPPVTGVKRSLNGLPMIPTPAQASLERKNIMEQNMAQKTAYETALEKLAFPGMRFMGKMLPKAVKPLAGEVGQASKDMLMGAGMGYAADRGYTLVTGEDAPGFMYVGGALGGAGRTMSRFMPKGVNKAVHDVVNNNKVQAAAMPLIATGVIGNAQRMAGGVDYMTNPMRATQQAKDKTMQDMAAQMGFGSTDEMIRAAQRAGAIANSPVFKSFGDRQINASGGQLYTSPYYR